MVSLFPNFEVYEVLNICAKVLHDNNWCCVTSWRKCTSTTAVSGTLMCHVKCTSNAIHVTPRATTCSVCQYKLTNIIKYLRQTLNSKTSFTYCLISKFLAIFNPETMANIVQLESPDGDSATVHLHGKLEFF